MAPKQTYNPFFNNLIGRTGTAPQLPLAGRAKARLTQPGFGQENKFNGIPPPIM